MLVAQDIAKIPQGIKAGKLPFYPLIILHFLSSFYHLKSSLIIQLSSKFMAFDD